MDARDFRENQRLGEAGLKGVELVAEAPEMAVETVYEVYVVVDVAATATKALVSGARVLVGQLAPSAKSSLYWHGTEAAVENARVEGLFAHGPGNGGKYWATSLRSRSKVTYVLIGGTKNVESLVPLRLGDKGAFEAVYTLTPEEAAHFSRAWGPRYSWNPYQWYKGASGQYYCQAVPVTWGQRGVELGRAGTITVIIVGGVSVGTEIIDWYNGQ